ncbi:MAG: site-specific DNA-methyltransferase [Armatimonadetes bacterium]|nr:site-specific DNA-methyltransferase [Armatimonadota bacterium]
MPTSRIIIGDAETCLKDMPEESVHAIVTSPPYWFLRDYGVKGQIGLEPTVDQYVRRLVKVFRKARRVLRHDGTLWLNLGDSYIGSGKAAGRKDVRQFGARARSSHQNVRIATPSSGNLSPKNLAGIPWRVALAMQRDGWLLRCDIIWHKPNCTPESVKDRPTRCHEYMFLFSKGRRYYYDSDALREPHMASSLRRMRYAHRPPPGSASPRGRSNSLRSIDMCHPLGKNKRSVWTVPVALFKGPHYAVFPPKLIEPCILAGSPVGGTVLDPFVGSGTTIEVALANGRHAIGIDIDPKSRDLIAKRLEKPEYMPNADNLPFRN